MVLANTPRIYVPPSPMYLRLQCFMQAGKFLAFPLTDNRSIQFYVLDLTLGWYLSWRGDFGSRHATDTYTRVLEAGGRHHHLHAASGSHVVQTAATCGLLHMDDHVGDGEEGIQEAVESAVWPGRCRHCISCLSQCQGEKVDCVGQSLRRQRQMMRSSPVSRYRDAALFRISLCRSFTLSMETPGICGCGSRGVGESGSRSAWRNAPYMYCRYSGCGCGCHGITRWMIPDTS